MHFLGHKTSYSQTETNCDSATTGLTESYTIGISIAMYGENGTCSIYGPPSKLTYCYFYH